MIGSTIKAGTARMKSAAQATRGGRPWAGWCLSAAGRFVGWPGGRDTAALACAASKIVSTDAAAAPAGCLHWWTDGGPGHVAVSLGGRRAFMASAWVTREHGEVWHPALGVVDVVAYSHAKPGLTYRGWSYDLDGVVVKDAVVLVQVPDSRTVWQLTPTLRRQKVSAARLLLLKKRGVKPVAVTAARLDTFRVA